MTAGLQQTHRPPSSGGAGLLPPNEGPQPRALRGARSVPAPSHTRSSRSGAQPGYRERTRIAV